MSIKTVARRQNVYPIRLKRLYNRLQKEDFFQQPRWEEHVLSCSEFSASTYSSHDSDLDGDGESPSPLGMGRRCNSLWDRESSVLFFFLHVWCRESGLPATVGRDRTPLYPGYSPFLYAYVSLSVCHM